MMKTGIKLLAASALSAAALGWSAPASATYMVTVYEADVGHAFDATKASEAVLLGSPGLSEATFNYNGPLSFMNNASQNSDNHGDLNSDFFTDPNAITGYVGVTVAANPDYGMGNADYSTKNRFLKASGSVAGYGWGSLYEFTSSVGDYSGLMLTITHDDGVSVYANGTDLLPGTTVGPTQAITETVTLPTGTTSYTIVYGRENGSPSVLNVAAVPEPASWAMMIGGFGLVGGAMRRRPHVAIA